jgi:folate-dependent phosphoribosylglycinamide formyltransferase PurN
VREIDFAADCQVAVVVSNIEDAIILERARSHGVETVHIPSKGRKRTEFDADVNAALEARGVDLVLLVGFMRILSPVFVGLGRIVALYYLIHFIPYSLICSASLFLKR